MSRQITGPRAPTRCTIAIASQTAAVYIASEQSLKLRPSEKMGKPAARLGDSTAHGGVITSGAPTVFIGGKPAARVGDAHTCPMQTPAPAPVPHVGGPIVSPGTPTVLICGQPAACVGDIATCTGPPDTIIPPGCPTVMIGVGGAASLGLGLGGMTDANSTSAATGDKDIDTEADSLEKAPGLKEEQEDPEEHYLDFRFVDKGGKPIYGLQYAVTSPSENRQTGYLSCRIKKTGIEEGTYKVSLQAIINTAWGCKKARNGEPVDMIVETTGVENGVPVTFVVLERTPNRSPRTVRTVSDVPIEDGKAKATWSFKWERDIDDRPGTEDKPARYSSPDYFFQVHVADMKAYSPMLDYKDYVAIELRDENNDPVPEAEYRLYLANGEIRTGKLDRNGYKREENVTPGSYRAEFIETAETEEHSDVADEPQEVEEIEQDDEMQEHRGIVGLPEQNWPSIPAGEEL